MAIGVYERTDAHRRALSLSHIGNVQSKETREKISKNHIGMKGKKHSEKTKERIRKAKIGSKHSEETKKKMSMNRVGKKPEAYTMLGKKHSEYTKKRISDARIGKWSGEDAPNWRGGKSFEEYPREFFQIRDEIRERDAYICQECFAPENGNEHHVHHIDYDKENNKPVNLILLCVSCHTTTNFNREYWEKKLTLKMVEWGIN